MYSTFYINNASKKWVAACVFLGCFFIPNVIYAQSGCTDPLANNFDSGAVTNDGSCTYDFSSISPVSSTQINSTLNETSGLVLWNNELWTHNDGGNTTEIFNLDTSDLTSFTALNIPGVTNEDWEDIAQDSDYIYIGDFGNNANGNRTDLKIYRISKTSILQGAPVVDEIYFSYEDQIDFSAQGGNNTDFDCEAMIVVGDTIFLFTKEWVSQQTTIYALPKTPGTYSATNEGNVDVDGLITGATFMDDKQLIVLSGYSDTLDPFLFLIYDFAGNNFTIANHRKINLNLPVHQVEGITSRDGLNYYLSNEFFSQTIPIIGTITTSPKIHQVNLNDYLLDYLGYETTGNAGNFNNVEAWAPGIIPPSGSEVFITHDLNLDQNYTAESLQVNDNATLTTNAGFTLSIQNNLSIQPNATLRLQENSILNAEGDIVNDGALYFESNSNGTAQFAEFNANASGAGQVAVERYIPASNRAFRFLSTPVSSAGSIRENWQQNGLNPGNSNYQANLGTHITGQGGSANGFDDTATNNPSMYTFNNSGNTTSTQDDDWEEVNNTNNTALQANTPYVLFVRGDRTSSNLTANPPIPQATKLKTTGNTNGFFIDTPISPTLNQTNEYFSLVANPFQAVVDFDQVSTTNLRADIIVYDPSFGTNGQYETLTENRFIEPGQSFFVQNDMDVTDLPGGASIAFEETDKALSGSSGVSAFNEDNIRALNLELYNENDIRLDVVKFRFQAGGNNAYGNEDMGKLFCSTESLCAVNANTFLSVERRHLPQDDEVIPLHIEQYQSTNYAFKVILDNWDNSIDVYVFDQYLDTYAQVTPSQAYAFSVDNGIPESLASDRFSLVFNPQNLSINQENRQARVVLSPNPVINSDIELHIPPHVVGNKAEIEIIDLTGQVVFTKDFSLLKRRETLEFSEFAKGFYILSLNGEHYKQKIKFIKH